jgi:hypothetical protein
MKTLESVSRMIVRNTGLIAALRTASGADSGLNPLSAHLLGGGNVDTAQATRRHGRVELQDEIENIDLRAQFEVALGRPIAGGIEKLQGAGGAAQLFTNALGGNRFTGEA